MTQACLAAGFLPQRAPEVGGTSIMLTLVAAGLGVALLPDSVLAPRVEGVGSDQVRAPHLLHPTRSIRGRSRRVFDA